MSSLLAASTNKTFARSTIGIKVKHAIAALTKNIPQKTIFPFLDCSGNGFGTFFTSVLKKFKDKKLLVSGINITKDTIILSNVNNSLYCHI